MAKCGSDPHFSYDARPQIESVLAWARDIKGLGEWTAEVGHAFARADGIDLYTGHGVSLGSVMTMDDAKLVADGHWQGDPFLGFTGGTEVPWAQLVPSQPRHAPWYLQAIHWTIKPSEVLAKTIANTVAHPQQFLKVVSDLNQIGLGALLTAGGGAGFSGGAMADATVVFLPLGVVIDAASLAAMGAGVAVVGHGGKNLWDDIRNLEARSKKSIQADKGYGARPSPQPTPEGGNPYKQEVADRVPGWGLDGTGKSAGAVDLGNGKVEDVVSGKLGPFQDMPSAPRPETGYNGNVLTHVEAHATALMRLTGTDNANSISTGTLASATAPTGAHPCWRGWFQRGRSSPSTVPVGRR
jgi:hypothetical protein